MLDLETMGTSSNSAILSIGAVDFDRDLGIISKFYRTIDLQNSLDHGFEINGATIYWWLKQSDEARATLTDKRTRVTIKEALKDFQEFIGKGNLQMWGNGSDFDNVILTNAFKRFKVQDPWPFWSNRCFKTIKSSFKSVYLPRLGEHHNALDDAEHQALVLIEIVKANKLKDVI